MNALAFVAKLQWNQEMDVLLPLPGSLPAASASPPPTPVRWLI